MSTSSPSPKMLQSQQKSPDSGGARSLPHSPFANSGDVSTPRGSSKASSRGNPSEESSNGRVKNSSSGEMRLAPLPSNDSCDSLPGPSYADPDLETSSSLNNLSPDLYGNCVISILNYYV